MSEKPRIETKLFRMRRLNTLSGPGRDHHIVLWEPVVADLSADGLM